MGEQITLFFWNNQNLFSNNYLQYRLPETDLWKSQKERASSVLLVAYEHEGAYKLHTSPTSIDFEGLASAARFLCLTNAHAAFLSAKIPEPLLEFKVLYYNIVHRQGFDGKKGSIAGVAINSRLRKENFDN
jgi:hypothetical protein